MDLKITYEDRYGDEVTMASDDDVIDAFWSAIQDYSHCGRNLDPVRLNLRAIPKKSKSTSQPAGDDLRNSGNASSSVSGAPVRTQIGSASSSQAASGSNASQKPRGGEILANTLQQFIDQFQREINTAGQQPPSNVASAILENTARAAATAAAHVYHKTLTTLVQPTDTQKSQNEHSPRLCQGRGGCTRIICNACRQLIEG